MPDPTFFLPAERALPEDLRLQARSFAEHGLMRELIDSGPALTVVLNANRQIVFASRAFLDFIGATSGDQVIGMRPGEALQCDNAWARSGGCGTSEFCQDCGAARAILAAQKGMPNAQECRIARRKGDRDESLEMLVSTAPLEFAGERYVACHVADIGHEKRRRILERVFFHDVLNAAGNVQGIAEALAGIVPPDGDEWLALLRVSAEQIVSEIRAQQELLAAETGELETSKRPINTREILETVAAMYRHSVVAEGKHIQVTDEAPAVEFVSDPILLTRALGNLVKNALEASAPGDTVRLDCRPAQSRVEFRIANPAVMPESVQRQVFSRSFSTKGAGRGLGTYSVKLLTERYLGGEVAFRSTTGEGTSFIARIPSGTA